MKELKTKKLSIILYRDTLLSSVRKINNLICSRIVFKNNDFAKTQLCCHIFLYGMFSIHFSKSFSLVKHLLSKKTHKDNFSHLTSTHLHSSTHLMLGQNLFSIPSGTPVSLNSIRYDYQEITFSLISLCTPDFILNSFI